MTLKLSGGARLPPSLNMRSCLQTTFSLVACPLLFVLISASLALYVVFGVVFNETIVHGRHEAQCLVLSAELACPSPERNSRTYGCWNIRVTYSKLRELNKTTKVNTKYLAVLPTELDRCRSYETCRNSSVPCLYNPHNLKDVKVKEPYKLVVVVAVSAISGSVFLWAIFSFVVLLRSCLEERKQESGSNMSELFIARQRDILFERRMDRHERGLETDTDSGHSSLDSLSGMDGFVCEIPPSPLRPDG
jgi:hypothetical protein